MHSSDEKTIDLMDLLVEILYRWKSILVITLIITLLAAGVSFLRSGRSAGASGGEAPSEETLKAQEELLLEETRSPLTEAEAKDVDRVYRQYQSYLDYRNLFQEELANYDKPFDGTGEEMQIKCVSYRISSTLEGVESQFNTYAIAEEDYRKIMDILPDAKTLSAAYKHVSFGTMAGNTVELTNAGESTAIKPSEYVVTVEMQGTTREVCDAVSEVVDAAFQRKLKQLKKVDPDLRLEQIGSMYRGNIYDYFIARKQTTFDYIQRVDSVITNLKLYSIDKFTDDQKAYFNALLDPERGLIDKGVVTAEALSGEEAESGSRGISKKMVLLGVLAGLFLSMLYILVRYLFSGMINVGQEMQDYYHIPVLNTFFVSGGRGRGLFPGLIRRILHVDSTETETKAAMIAADTCGAVQQADAGSVYIVQTCDNTEDSRIASILRQAVRSHSPSCQAATGLPLGSVEQMQALTEEKCALLLVHNKKTLQADVEKVLDLCSRHSVKVLGAVTITDL